MIYLLGKKAPRKDPRTLKLSKYTKNLADPPDEVAWQKNMAKYKWGMFGNDSLGDCVFATMGHMIQNWSSNVNGEPTTPEDKEIIAAYSAVTGYTPSDPYSDQGAVEIDALNWWRKNTIHDVKLHAYVGLDEKSHKDIKQAIHLFGAAYIGLALPISAQDQDIWDVPEGGATGDGYPGSWGGHAVHVLGYDKDYLYLITWAEVKKMTWAFWDAYCDESYAPLSEEWISEETSKSPSGFALDELESDLTEITG